MAVRLIVGCGYLGREVASLWQSAGDEVHAVTRSAERAVQWNTEGLRSHVADVTRPTTLVDLPAADTVLLAVGYDRRAGVAMREVYVEGLQNVLNALPETVGRIIYVSSTGVYGPAAGDWVDESTPCQPEREGGIACWEAEQRLVAHRLGSRSIRLRLAGIYGPGRVPFLAALQRGEAIATPADSWLNLIHVQDAARVVVWMADHAATPELYVVADNQPVRRREFYDEVARQIGAPAPRFAEPEATTAQLQRAAGDKRVDARKVWQAMSCAPHYPSFREGLAACRLQRG